MGVLSAKTNSSKVMVWSGEAIPVELVTLTAEADSTPVKQTRAAAHPPRFLLAFADFRLVSSS